MARRNTMKVACPECSSINIRMSRWRNRWEQTLDLFGMPPMRCSECGHRWRHSLWRIREMFFARCPRCYRLELTTWDETYYHVPVLWRVLTGVGAKKVRCKACRHNFISFRFVKNFKNWVNKDGSIIPLVEETFTVNEVESGDGTHSRNP